MLQRAREGEVPENYLVEIDEEAAPQRVVLTQRLFPNVSELQVCVAGVSMRPRRRDAVDVAVRESTRRARESRPCRDGVRSTQEEVGPEARARPGEGRPALQGVLSHRITGLEVLCDVAGVFEATTLTQKEVVPAAIRWRGSPEAMHPGPEAAGAHRLEVLPVSREALQAARDVLV